MEYMQLFMHNITTVKSIKNSTIIPVKDITNILLWIDKTLKESNIKNPNYTVIEDDDWAATDITLNIKKKIMIMITPT